MARPIDEMAAAWRALSGETACEGWKSIPITPTGSCRLLAARHFPGNEEALLAGFPTARLPAAEKLPDGVGFSVARVKLNSPGAECTWLALSRKQSGSQELFAAMVADVTGAMDAEASAGEERILRLFLGRVRAWQEFMRKGTQHLGPEAEVGLIGELCFLTSMVEAGIPALTAVEAWEGPLDGIQDFALGAGAIEVKATISTAGFPAKIGSLEQLDDALRSPLFLAGERLSVTASGMNIQGFVERALQSFNGDSAAESLFRNRLLAAGYLETHADHYSRRFSRVGTRVVEVVDGFPRIVTGLVPLGIRKVSYEIDLDRAGGSSLSTTEALKKLGVL